MNSKTILLKKDYNFKIAGSEKTLLAKDYNKVFNNTSAPFSKINDVYWDNINKIDNDEKLLCDAQ